MILVDTSVWIDHFRSGDTALAALLDRGEVLSHPLVLGELACGNIGNRVETLHLLSHLPQALTATDAEVLGFIEHNQLMGRGIGYIDAHLLAATALSDASRLWTRDKRLATVAAEMNLGVAEEIASRIHERRASYTG
ncbi:MAG TPA: type II toxin-antitoxin system VapC family toxin [Gammaproteobacteria bacterium]|nr:type II toxin-antitoxin system VapC family toxin [Gammaproteobacteria bacterium]HET7587053.1 type II toxin-antitoxin system VapC family toxin [Gammaproteobacteria bacterium]